MGDSIIPSPSSKVLQRWKKIGNMKFIDGVAMSECRRLALLKLPVKELRTWLVLRKLDFNVNLDYPTQLFEVTFKQQLMKEWRMKGKSLVSIGTWKPCIYNLNLIRKTTHILGNKLKIALYGEKKPSLFLTKDGAIVLAPCIGVDEPRTVGLRDITGKIQFLPNVFLFLNTQEVLVERSKSDVDIRRIQQLSKELGLATPKLPLPF